MNNTDRLCLGCMNDNGGEQICPICGYDASSEADPSVLAPKSWIKDRFLVGRVFETNGEGITYIGWDNLNNNVVYIKEYFPQGIARRQEDKTVAPEENCDYEYNNVLLKFLEISEKLAELSHLPAVMPIVLTSELNGTAYSIIKSSPGIPLREFLLRNGGALKWEQAKPLFLPLITTVEGLNDAGIIHAGISPETVIVGRDGKLRLFGVAISDIRRAESAFTSQLFPGFAAIEQYDAEYETGPATDVYGLAATLFRVLIGNPPMSAPERLEHDNMSIPAKLAETIPPQVLSALANALQVKPEHRTSSAGEFARALSSYDAPAPQKERAERISSRSSSSSAAPAPAPNKKDSGSRHYAVVAAAATAGVIVVLALALIFTVFRNDIFRKTGGNSSVSAPSVSSVGEVDPNVSNDPVEKLYQVPDFRKKKYSDVIGNVDYDEIYDFTIKESLFNDKVPEGYIIEQSVKSGESVKKDTEIALTVSAGPSQLTVPNLTGRTREEAYIALLELGFAKDNIEFIERYDDTKPPKSVLSAEPTGKVSRFAKITVYINSYEEPSSDYDALGDDQQQQNGGTPSTVSTASQQR